MALLEGTVATPFGHLPKTGVAVAVGGVALVLGVAWYRSKNAAAATPAVDPNATDPNATDPALDPYSSGNAGLNTGGYYDGSGNWIPYGPQSSGGSSPGTPGPGSFTNNSEWSQYVQQYLTGTTGLDPATVGHAIGNYLTGTAVDDSQITIINQAIAAGDRPPIAGPNGNPPGYIHAGTSPPPTTTKVSVPKVTGDNYGKAFNTIRNAGLVPSPDSGVNAAYVITGQSPAAGTKVDKGAIVKLTYRK